MTERYRAPGGPPVRCDINQRDCPRCGMCEHERYLDAHRVCHVCCHELSGRSVHSVMQLLARVDRSFDAPKAAAALPSNTLRTAQWLKATELNLM